MKSPQLHIGSPTTVDRYDKGTRVNHWITAASFVLLAISGLAFYNPRLFFLTEIFGGGSNARALHPIIGVVLALSFTGMFPRFRKSNIWKPADTAWMKGVSYVVSGEEEKLPEVEKYNAGQKIVFWAMTVAIALLFITGLIVWDEYFYDLTSIPVKRIAIVAHAIVATLAIVVLIIHIYSAIWVRGSVGAMLNGRVTAGWSWKHHRKWLRRLAGGGVDDDYAPRVEGGPRPPT
jgi:formate dehydrogenase subunit gamma